MPFTLTMPKLSPTMEEGSIVKWHKQVGEFVEAGDVILEIATDKATVEYQALDAGWLKRIEALEGVEVKVNQPIAIFTEEEGESIEGYVPTGVFNEKQETLNAKEEDVLPLKEKQGLETSKNHLRASPLAKKLAAQRGIDLFSIQGSGPRGRIMSRDLVLAQTKDENVSFNYEEETLTPMRKTIAKRLQEAKMKIPHFYVEQEVQAEPLLALKEQLNVLGIKVSINDLIICAAARALKVHPEINKGFYEEKGTLLCFPTIDISFAVSLPQGLITPIIKRAETKGLKELSLEIRELTKRAKEGRLQPLDYQGGSFTVSNLGMYGISRFQAIINPPQGAILAVGAILTKPVVKQGQIVLGQLLNLNLSCDHRVIDGAFAALFLNTLKRYLENPAALLL